MFKVRGKKERLTSYQPKLQFQSKFTKIGLNEFYLRWSRGVFVSVCILEQYFLVIPAIM